MATYLPPLENVPIFDTLLFTSPDSYLTYNTASKYFLKYPYAQGTENLRNITISGSVGQTVSGNTECVQYGDSSSLSLASGTTGNSCFGYGSGININTSAANFNTLIGHYAGATITQTTQNTAVGATAMNNAGTLASNNTCVGVGALRYIQYGQNCAFGVGSLQSAGQTQGSTSYGFQNMYSQTTVALANANTSVGAQASYTNQTAGKNSSFGYRSQYYNIADENSSFGSLSLENNNIGTRNCAFGYDAGRHNTGSSNNYFGVGSGQLDADASVYNYLTCIGRGSGREAGVCSNNRFIFGSTSGNENYLFAGSGDFAHRDLTKAINLFGTQTGTITIGNTTSTSNIYIGQFVFSWGSSIATISNTSNTAQFQGQQTGATRFGGNQTTGTLTFGCSSASTGGGTTTINSANGNITIGSTNVTTANINVGNSLTSGNINIGNSITSGNITIGSNTATDGGNLNLYSSNGNINIGGSNLTSSEVNIGISLTSGNVNIGNHNAGGGEIFLNRSINLPPSTSWTIPTTGQLGYTTAIPITVTTNFSTGQATLPSSVSNITQFSQPFNFPEKGVFLVNCWFGLQRSGSTGGVTTRIGISTNNTTCPDGQSNIQFYTGTTNGLKINPITLYTTITVTNTSTNYYITGNTGLATITDQVYLGDALVYITRIA